MVRLILASMIASIAVAKPPPPFEHAKTARWMLQNLDWGFLVTTSTRSTASSVGDAFGNPYAVADSNGIPYFYASDLDASMVDIFFPTSTASRVSFSMSEAQFTGNSSVAACQIGSGQFSDPLNPPCARLVLSGNFVRLAAGSSEEATAKSALFDKHPSFKFFPPGHAFFAGKLDIDGIWLIDFYGSATIVSPDDYFGVSASNFYRQEEMQPVLRASGPPNPLRKIATARWMANTLNWGMLSTTSTRSEGTTPGDAFGNPYAFADSDGVPCFFASDLDASVIDLQQSTRMTFALSEAELSGTAAVKACTIGVGFGDPENPPCARLVFGGDFVRLDTNTTEGANAQAALFDRHPSFVNFPQDHDFFVAKLEIDAIWFIDMYGGATNMSPKKYLAFSDEVHV